jgi:hypothetical protein
LVSSPDTKIIKLLIAGDFEAANAIERGDEWGEWDIFWDTILESGEIVNGKREEWLWVFIKK